MKRAESRRQPPRAKVRARIAENPQYLKPAAGRSHQFERMLAQLLSLVGFQAVDELMKVAVIVFYGHKPKPHLASSCRQVGQQAITGSRPNG